jgi:hypothetical protein
MLTAPLTDTVCPEIPLAVNPAGHDDEDKAPVKTPVLLPMKVGLGDDEEQQ